MANLGGPAGKRNIVRIDKKKINLLDKSKIRASSKLIFRLFALSSLH